MTKCYRGCRHRTFVGEYHVARESDEAQRDNEVGVYGPGSQEWTDYNEARPPITFHEWLKQTKGWGEL